MNKFFTSLLVLLSFYSFSQVNLESGLQAYYPFNGNANDESANGNNGVETNITYSTGKVGQCASFNGSSKIDVTNSQFVSGLSNYTISVWVQLNKLGQRQMITNVWGTGGSSDDNFILDYNALGGNTFASQVGLLENSRRSDLKGGVPTASQWYHLLVTVNTVQNTHSLYIDGILIESNIITTLTGSVNVPFQIGHYYNSLFLDGKLDELRIYNRVLTQEEITQLSLSLVTSAPNLVIEKSNVNVYPTPANDQLNIDFDNIHNEEVLTFELVNTNGNVVLEEEITVFDKNFSHSINVNGISSGLYVIKIQGNTFSHQAKVILF